MIKQFQMVTGEKSKYGVWLLAASVILLALVIRLIGLGAESAWIDEAYSISLARYPIAQILQGTASDQHPPLYYLLLHVWMLFGKSVPYVRLLSAIFGTLNVVQVMAFGWKVAGRWLGIWAAFLLAISPFHVWYSQEVRQYMLLACLTTAATVELWNCINGKRRWWLYCLFVILAIFTQYFAVFILIAHAVIIVLWAYRQRNPRLVILWIITMVGVGLAFAPWLPTAINQFLNHTMPWIGEPAIGDIRNVGLRLIFGDGVLLLPVMLRWVGLVCLLVVTSYIFIRYLSKNSEARKVYGFIILWAVIPFIAISLVAKFYPIFQFKQYLIILAPSILAVTGVTIIIHRPWGGIFFAGLALVSGLTLVVQQIINTKDDWRGVANYINTHKENSVLVYSNPAASSLALNLYWEKSLPINGYPPNYNIISGGWAGEPLTPQVANEVLSTATRGYKHVWLVEFFPEFWDKYEYLPTWLASHGDLLDDKSFNNIHLRLYELSP
jgi:uncharacterized membrane protein